MRAVTAIAVATAAVLGAASSTAGQGFPFPKTGGAFTRAPQESKPPVVKLKEEALRHLQSQAGLGARTMVCGMTVIPANPAVDPKSIKKAPTDRKYTMRSVPPPACAQESFTVVVPPPTVAPR